jgi:transposase-like protein
MKTLLDAVRYFADPKVCIDTVASMRWDKGEPVCPKCNGKNVLWLANQLRWKCRTKGCAKQFSVKVGTILEDSPIALDKWLVGMWLIGNCKNGISSYEVARDLGITQKSAWFMLHRIRVAMKDKPTMLTLGGNRGTVEVDETFIGGKAINKHANKQPQKADKAIVMGMLDRKTRQIRAKVIPNVKRGTLQAEILKNVGFNSHVYTDQHVGYDGLNNLKNFTHKTVNHMNEYVNGKVHTQGIENFWACLKRSLHGTYVAVEPFHLDAYVDEQVFRFNTSKTHSDETRLAKVLKGVAGRRLTYAELTGKVGDQAF